RSRADISICLVSQSKLYASIRGPLLPYARRERHGLAQVLWGRTPVGCALILRAAALNRKLRWKFGSVVPTCDRLCSAVMLSRSRYPLGETRGHGFCCYLSSN